jgi:Fe-Mn family superoxide dismutase
MPSHVKDQLTESFSSVDTLRLEMIATADAMFGPGFVWLVQIRDSTRATGYCRLLTTYNAGSPYSGAHYRRQAVDMATQSDLPKTSAEMARYQPVNTVGAFGEQSPAKKIAPGGVDVIPLLCVNTWEHVWLRDYGIGNKRAFLESWWNRIDWNAVNDHMEVGAKIGKTPSKFIT